MALTTISTAETSKSALQPPPSPSMTNQKGDPSPSRVPHDNLQDNPHPPSHSTFVSTCMRNIFLDGGVTKATLLPDYDPAITKYIYSRRSSLLKELRHLGAGNFQVDTSSDPHIIRLLSPPMQQPQAENPSEKVRSNLKSKLITALFARLSKAKRRKTTCPPAPLPWLLRQCTLPMHNYLRPFLFYPKSKLTSLQAGSPEWISAALPHLSSFICECYLDTREATSWECAPFLSTINTTSHPS